MFLFKQNQDEIDEYKNLLTIVGSLSNLFSESNVPYLYYRIAENIFCKAFSAENLSRSDVSVDAKKDGLGIGLKTFLLGNSKTFQKVAEFNNDRPLYENLPPQDLIKIISNLRNTRVKFTNKAHKLSNSIYHCVSRDEGKFLIFEENMDLIDISNIRDIKQTNNSIKFNDTINEYSFLLSKSTLTKRFIANSTTLQFDIDILKEPLKNLKDCFEKLTFVKADEKIKQTIYLPLYGHNYKVYPRSGLNQWNASGRKRDPNEVYIPIPIQIHIFFANFFPNRDTPFSLNLPNGETIQSKVCQDNGKALMSHSNRELGEWILREILNLKEGELVTIAKLQYLGIDSVRIDKIDDLDFEINFAQTGSFEQFKNNFLL